MGNIENCSTHSGKNLVLRGKIRIKDFDWAFVADVLIWILAHAQRHHSHADNSRISRPDNVLAAMTMCKFWRPANIEYYCKYIHTIYIFLGIKNLSFKLILRFIFTTLMNYIVLYPWCPILLKFVLHSQSHLHVF